MFRGREITDKLILVAGRHIDGRRLAFCETMARRTAYENSLLFNEDCKTHLKPMNQNNLGRRLTSLLFAGTLLISDIFTFFGIVVGVPLR